MRGRNNWNYFIIQYTIMWLLVPGDSPASPYPRPSKNSARLVRDSMPHPGGTFVLHEEPLVLCCALGHSFLPRKPLTSQLLSKGLIFFNWLWNKVCFHLRYLLKWSHHYLGSSFCLMPGIPSSLTSNLCAASVRIKIEQVSSPLPLFYLSNMLHLIMMRFSFIFPFSLFSSFLPSLLPSVPFSIPPPSFHSVQNICTDSHLTWENASFWDTLLKQSTNSNKHKFCFGDFIGGIIRHWVAIFRAHSKGCEFPNTSRNTNADLPIRVTPHSPGRVCASTGFWVCNIYCAPWATHHLNYVI